MAHTPLLFHGHPPHPSHPSKMHSFPLANLPSNTTLPTHPHQGFHNSSSCWFSNHQEQQWKVWYLSHALYVGLDHPPTIWHAWPSLSSPSVYICMHMNVYMYVCIHSYVCIDDIIFIIINMRNKWSPCSMDIVTSINHFFLTLQCHHLLSWFLC